MIHLFASIEDKNAVQQALSLSEEYTWHLQDNLCDGILNNGVDSFDTVRKHYAIELHKIPTDHEGYNDVTSIMKVSTFLSNHKDVPYTLWMSSHTQSVLFYYFVLHHLNKHLGRCHIINISGLPFLDANGKLFFPKKISELAPKEIEKCLKLTSTLSPATIEMDMDEWKKIREENAPLRILDGTKKIKSLPEDHYDQLLQASSKENQKPHRLAQVLISKHDAPCSLQYLIKRIESLQGVTNTAATTDSTTS